MLKAATARGLGPCGPRHPLLRPRYRHAAAPASPPLSLLAGRTCHLPSHSAVITSGSPVYGTYGGSSPRLHALAARPLGGSLCKAHPRRAYLYPMARSHTYGKPHPSLVTTTGRATHLQTRAANGPDSSSSSGISERATSASTDASAVAAAQLLSGALDAALLPRLEAIEGRIVEAVEAKVVERLGEQGQRTKELVEVGRVWGGSARATEVHGFIHKNAQALCPYPTSRMETDAVWLSCGSFNLDLYMNSGSHLP